MGFGLGQEAEGAKDGSKLRRGRSDPRAAPGSRLGGARQAGWLGRSGPDQASELTFRKSADVAQLAEQLICNQQVRGSIPLVSSLVEIGSSPWAYSSVTSLKTS